MHDCVADVDGTSRSVLAGRIQKPLDVCGALRVLFHEPRDELLLPLEERVNVFFQLAQLDLALGSLKRTCGLLTLGEGARGTTDAMTGLLERFGGVTRGVGGHGKIGGLGGDSVTCVYVVYVADVLTVEVKRKRI